MNDIVGAWVEGWTVSRGAAPPVRETWGFTIDVGRPDHVHRHVFGEAADEATVRKVAGEVTGSGVWLKVFRDPSVVEPWLGPGWWVDPEPGWLMTTPLTPTVPTSLAPAPEAAAPEGYTLRSWTRAGVTRVLVAAPDGSFAAGGQTAVTGEEAVFDQIETSPAHRRRGLGTTVMRALQSAAATQGARTGVLVGTPVGRALYETLGWRTTATLTSAKKT
ncbi:GNAT family N-acetyltransferase [Streptomyces roseirectus]|uniref:GNAT family N-acetyltransferase n=1 Tax=Streptomyces roseirectus TaxID=2768066 RepID=A0A7H0IBT4_9ACTN|nr:GNAT family N-acetyltransferase [Streptomyces roseirectus]QNP70250.1 GNAT family N-acetyltransferase [Streptomyces roseirectus]